MPGEHSRWHPATVTLLMSTLIIGVTGVKLSGLWATENKFGCIESWVRLLGPVQINSGWNVLGGRLEPRSRAAPSDQIRRGAAGAVRQSQSRIGQNGDRTGGWAGAAQRRPASANAVTSASDWNTAEKFPQVTFLGVNPEVLSPPPSQNYGGLIGALSVMGEKYLK